MISSHLRLLNYSTRQHCFWGYSGGFGGSTGRLGGRPRKRVERGGVAPPDGVSPDLAGGGMDHGLARCGALYQTLQVGVWTMGWPVAERSTRPRRWGCGPWAGPLRSALPDLAGGGVDHGLACCGALYQTLQVGMWTMGWPVAERSTRPCRWGGGPSADRLCRQRPFGTRACWRRRR